MTHEQYMRRVAMMTAIAALGGASMLNHKELASIRECLERLDDAERLITKQENADLATLNSKD